MAYGYSLESEYMDGYIHNEVKLGDVSPYVEGKNIFNDILEKRVEAEHGPMTRFSLIGSDKRYDIDWTSLPANARPIYYREMSHTRTMDGRYTDVIMNKQVFGYQYNDDSGENHKETTEII